tara:strand:+ start:386 stop:562 length:177 start_codon:yes stop_codon:yes gene_type:complete
MTHLTSKTSTTELYNLLTKLKKKKIYYKIKIREGIVIDLDSKDTELIKFAKSNNPELS